MTTKDIISAFRAGRISEAEAVARLVGRPRERVAGESPVRAAAPGPASPACDIAVIGMSGRFPDADNVERFWANLVQGRDSVREVPGSRWNADKYYDADRTLPGKSYSKWAGLLDDVESFDPLFFNISPLEARFMDPQQRLFLQEAWRAFEDAGYAPQALSGQRCGVFVGVSSGDYQFLLLEHGTGTDAYVLLGNIIAVLAGRIGYALNLKGPSLAIDTASSSSLVAIHHACQSLRMGESEIALAGGVAVLATPYTHILTSKTGALSRSGKCYTFDRRADGFVPSEAVAAIVLKPLPQALRDGDHVYGVIKGSGVNQDGSTNGITAPSAESQKNLQLRVSRECGVDPATLSYVECHGTATKLGDPIEIAALTDTFRTSTPAKQVCPVGSSKTNVGHALAACGIVGLIKVLCCLERKVLPASLHFQTSNPHIAFEDSPFYVNTTTRPWETARLPRRAAINSFGISGTNAHVVLEEFVPPGLSNDDANPSPALPVAVPLSARSEAQLHQYAASLLGFVESGWRAADAGSESTWLWRMAYTLQTGRVALGQRMVMLVRSVQELQSELRAFVGGGARGARTFHGPAAEPGPVADAPGAERDLVAMARAWALGGDVDWSALYATRRPRRLSLPTYPFARERYWVPTAEAGARHGLLGDALTPVAARSASVAPGLRCLQEVSRPVETREIDWAGAIGSHLGARLLFLYQREEDRQALAGLIEQCEAALETEDVFECSFVAADDPARLRACLQSLEAGERAPAALFCLPAPTTRSERSSVTAAFLTLAETLRAHAPQRVVAGFYGWQAVADGRDMETEALAAEIDALVGAAAEHAYRWVQMPVATPAFQKAATLLREWLAYPSQARTEWVEYRDEQRSVRLWEEVGVRAAAPGGIALRPGATYCVTGEPGDVGLSLCEELGRRHQVDVVLDPRVPLSDEESSRLAAAQERGARVRLAPAASVRDLRGIIDVARPVGEVREAPLSVVEKTWTSKPPSGSASGRASGNGLILVNADPSSRLVAGRLEQALDGRMFSLEGDWRGLEEGRAAARALLAEAGEIDYVFDLCDVHTGPRARDEAAYGRLGLYQELISRYRALTLLHFTRGREPFERPWSTLAGARQAGFVKMLSAEYGHVRAACVDVDDEFLASESLPARVAAEAQAPVEETEICYRRGQRFVPALRSRRLADGAGEGSSPLPVRPGGAYVISGGTNGIGLELAAALASAGARRLALMGITPLPPEAQWPAALSSPDVSPYVRQKIEKLLAIQATGASLALHTGPLTDAASLGAFLAAFRAAAGRIDGVVHSAGRAPDVSAGRFAFIHKTERDLQDVFEPKVDGLEALHDALRDDWPDFFVAFSSMATMVPRFGKGISDYAAANSFVDDFVDYQVSQGRAYFRSMAWVGWSDVGLHRAGAGGATGEGPERRASEVGLLFNSSHDGVRLFLAALSDGAAGGHRMPCLLDEPSFERSRERLLWARAAAPQAAQPPDGAAALEALDGATSAAPLDFFLLLSSLPGEGAEARRQARHNASRAAFAAQRHALATRGRRSGAALALQAGPWPQAARDAAALASFVESALSQHQPLALEPAVEGDFERLLARLKAADQPAREELVSDVDLDDFSDAQIEQLHALLFEPAAPVRASGSEPARAVPAVAALAEPPGASLREIKLTVDVELKRVLHLEDAAVSESGSFQHYGLDSISGMQLVSRLEKTLGVEVPPRWLIDYSTVDALAEKLVESRRARGQ